MLTKIKVYACYTVKIYKNKLQIFFQTVGARTQCVGPESGFDCIQGNVRPFLFSPLSAASSEGQFKIGQFFFLLLYFEITQSCLGELKTRQNSLHVWKGENNTRRK